jgi:hypothetical protein
MGDLGSAKAGIQRDWSQAKLNSIDKGAIHACGDNSVHITKLVHVVVKISTEDRVDDVDIGSSVSTRDKIIDELKVQTMDNLVSLVIVGLLGIRLCRVCVSTVIWAWNLTRGLPRIKPLSISKQCFWLFFWTLRHSESIKPPYFPKSKQVHFFETSRLYAYFLATS